MVMSLNALSKIYLKRRKRIDRKKIRKLDHLRTQTESTENDPVDSGMAAFLRIKLQANFILKALGKFHKYNEREKTDVLSMHASLEQYLSSIEMGNAELILRRMLFNVELDDLMRTITHRNQKDTRPSDVTFAVQQLGEQFDLNGGLIFLLSLHYMVKKRLIDIDAKNNELIIRYSEVCAELKELKELMSYENDNLECSAEISFD